MEKLEPKYIIPYLPHNLKWFCLDKPSGEYELHYMTGIFSYAGEMQAQVGNYDICLEDDLETDEEIFKPILKPLSSLTVNELYVLGLDSKISGIEHWGDIWVDSAISAEDMEFIVGKLFEWHYDLYGLIDKGLAMDINKLNQ